MYGRNKTLHSMNNSFSSSIEFNRTIDFRRNFIRNRRNGQSLDFNTTNLTTNTNNRNSVNNFQRQRDSCRIIPNDENNSLSSNLTNTENSLNLNITNPSDNFRRIKKLEKYKLYANLMNKNELNEIEEENQKEEKITSEIKDTVKCYICFDIITKPKMCPHCHRIACEKCLYNWFMIEQKKNCGFCRKKVNFYEMVSVPFMSTVVDFVEKVFDKEGEINFGEEFCLNHPNEKLFYYCLDCNRGYCQTCFVFFGEEKDRHVNHNIIKYEEYKNLNITKLKTYEEKINSNINKIEENIKKCMSYKNAYEFERTKGNEIIEKLKEEFNREINNNLNKIDEEIKKLKNYINIYKTHKIELNNYYRKFSNKNLNNNNGYSFQKMSQDLMNSLNKITSTKLYSNKEIEKLMDLSKSMQIRTYQSKLGEFNHENIFLSKNLKMGESPYELVIDNKQRNEVNISLVIPKNKINFQHNFLPFIFIRKKGSEVYTYELEEVKEDDKHFYYKKKIPWDYFGEPIFKIRGILYDYFFV